MSILLFKTSAVPVLGFRNPIDRNSDPVFVELCVETSNYSISIEEDYYVVAYIPVGCQESICKEISEHGDFQEVEVLDMYNQKRRYTCFDFTRLEDDDE